MQGTATKLKKVLDKSGLRHKHVAKLTGFRPDYFSGFVSGRRVPTRSEATAMARFLGVAIPEIFDTVLE